jgi:phosphoserine / homoserine phosphotransferase
MYTVCSDLEGIFTPEIWINVSEITGIKDLRLTTRDISDYDALMKYRLDILTANHLKLADIQAVIAKMEPLEGAVEFLNWLRSITPVIIVSDTYVEFAGPLIQKLGYPTLFCNTLSIAPDGSIAGYHLRQQDGKQKVVNAVKSLQYQVIAIGDSYNDISMLNASDQAILYRPPDNVKKEYSTFASALNYDELKKIILKTMNHRDQSL